MKETIVGGKTLKVKFTQDGKKVTAQVLEQSENLRNKGVIICRDGYSIKSISHPTIGRIGEQLFVRGTTKSCDNILDTWFFESEEKATAYINGISKLIREINRDTEDYTKMNESIIIHTDGFKVVTATLYDKSGKQIREGKAKCSPEDTFDFETGAMLAFERLTSKKIIVGDKTLRAEFTRYGKEVTAKVLEMDESMRGKYEIMKRNSYEIQSVTCPQISEKALYVRGRDTSKDHTEAKQKFDSVMKAKEYIKNISELILKINAERKWNAKVVCVKSHDRDSFTKGKIYSVENGKIKDDRGIYVGNYKSVDEANKNLKTGKFIEIVD